MKKIFILYILVFSLLVNVFAKSKGVKMNNSNNNQKILVAYFSRTGEQYAVGNISIGNTKIIADMIKDKLKADIFEIKVKVDNYPSGYEDLTKYAKDEKNKNFRPEIVGKIENFSDYDTIFIGYPNWWGDMPMPVYTFVESYDFTGKKVIPFCTHEGSGIGTTANKLQKVIKGKVVNGLGIYGHIAQNDKEEAESRVNSWLKSLGY